MCLLELASVTNSPAVNPLTGTSHTESEKRKFFGLVHSSFWSPPKSSARSVSQ